MGLGAQVEGMQRPITLLPTLRSTSTALLLSFGLGLPACGDDGGSLESGDEPGSTGAATTDSPDPSGDPPAPTSSEPTTSDEPGSTGEPDPETGDTGDTGEPGETGTTGDVEPTLEQQLEGRWISEACEPMPQADGSVLYFGRDFTLGLGTWSIVGTIYGDDACSFPLLTLDIGGGFEVVGPAVGIDGAYEANFDRDSIALTPHVGDFVAWFDGEGCGEQPWAVGVQQDVTAEGCAFVPSAEACPVEHDLVALDGTDRLFFGQRPVEGDMCSPRTRPTALGEHAVARQAR
jgi:hypothetical protein